MKKVPISFKAYSIFLTVCASALLFYLVSATPMLSWQHILLFGLLIWLAESFGIDLPKVGAVSVSFALLYAAILLLGPASAALAALSTAVVWRDIKERSSFYRWLANGSLAILDTGIAGLVYLYAHGPILMVKGLSYSDFPWILIPFILCAAAYFLINSSLVSMGIGFLEDISPVNIWLFDCKWAIPNYFALAPLGVILAQIYVKAGPAGIVLLIAPLLIARQTFQVYMELRGAYMGTVKSLVAAVEAKDPYTRGHSERVAEYAEKIARQLHLPEEKIETLKYAALLHDVGKIGITRRILSKPGKLTHAEYRKVEEHPEIGVAIIREIEFLKEVVPAIFHHHERVDGSGYVDGTKGEMIPLMARILAVADSYDAMTSARPYRPALDQETVIEELTTYSGSQWDKILVNALMMGLGLNANPREGEKRKGQMSLVGYI
ncbi:MAG: HD-GYP domain-containing protein [Actinomycetota bacterium]|nr:HD-GYP domain-containing protein [Actinomycetota bacterium]